MALSNQSQIKLKLLPSLCMPTCVCTKQMYYMLNETLNLNITAT